MEANENQNFDRSEFDWAVIFTRLYFGQTIEPYRLERNFFVKEANAYIDFVIWDTTKKKIVYGVQIDGQLDDHQHNPYRFN